MAPFLTLSLALSFALSLALSLTLAHEHRSHVEERDVSRDSCDNLQEKSLIGVSIEETLVVSTRHDLTKWEVWPRLS